MTHGRRSRSTPKAGRPAFSAALTLACALLIGGCADGRSFDAESSVSAEPQVGLEGVGTSDSPWLTDEALTAAVPTTTSGAPPVASASFSGGIPMGTTALPVTQFGATYNGAVANIAPENLLSSLAGIKARGGKVILMLVGNDQYYKSADGTFSLTKWKQRVDRFKRINFSSYLSDGTVAGHYIIDEPNDPANWNGRPIPPSTVEDMAKYSKSLWPTMATIARAEPTYLKGSHPYLDAAWAQYVYRKGPVADFIRTRVAEAQSQRLALVVGLNVIKGGVNGSKMTASQILSWGTTLLGSTYPCAFISWQYDAKFLSSAGIKSAMDALRQKAEKRTAKSCRS